MPTPMMGSERLEVVKVREKFGKGLLNVKTWRDETFICVSRNIIPDVLQFIKSDPDLEYSYFSEAVAVDYSRWADQRDLEERFEVVYNLMSLKHFSRIFIKIGANDGDRIPTVKHIFVGADYPEREMNDMFGLIFDGNEHAERFLMADDWVGYPLRKEYPLGGEDVLFDRGERGPAVEDVSMPHAGESFEGKTGSNEVSGR